MQRRLTLLILLILLTLTARAQTDGGIVRGSGADPTSSALVFVLPDYLSPTAFEITVGEEVRLLGRGTEAEWVYIEDPNGLTGWMWADQIETDARLPDLPLVEISPELILDNAPLWNFSDNARRIFEEGERQGNIANTFIKVGDSITISRAFLYHFTSDFYNLGEYAYLQDVLDYYGLGDDNPFSHFSETARTGWSVRDPLRLDLAQEHGCLPDERLLECEYRVEKPAAAIILLGTNDVKTLQPDEYRRYLDQIIEVSLAYGVVPLLTTIPPQPGYDQTVRAFNLEIVAAVETYDVPLINFWQGCIGLPNNCISPDNVHPSTPYFSDQQAVIFSEENLEFGYTVRNLLTLQALYILIYNIQG